MEENGSRKPVILGIALVVLLGAAGYRWWSTSEDTTPPLVRSVSDFIVNWECLDCGNRTENNAGAGPHKCGKCGKDNAYAAIMWACPTHGATTFYFQYDAAGNPSQIRTKAGPWVPAFSPEGGWNIKCPTCKAGMMPAESPRRAPEKPGSE